MPMENCGTSPTKLQSSSWTASAEKVENCRKLFKIMQLKWFTLADNLYLKPCYFIIYLISSMILAASLNFAFEFPPCITTAWPWHATSEHFLSPDYQVPRHIRVYSSKRWWLLIKDCHFMHIFCDYALFG